MITTIPTSRARIAAISRRLMVTATILGFTLVIAVTLFGWARYRLDHVVIRDAQVKGVVTRIGARLDGQIQTVLVAPGQLVRSNDVLVVLDHRHLEASLARMTAEHAAAAADYEAARLALEQSRQVLTLKVAEAASEVETADADIATAVSELTKIAVEYDRVVSLNASGISSASDLDTSTADRQRALAVLAANRAEKKSATIRLQQAEADLAGIQVEEAQLSAMAAKVRVAAGRMEEVQSDIAASHIRAPGQGWVIERLIEAGGSAKVGEPMIALWLGDPWVEAHVSEESLRDVRVGSPVELEVLAFPELELQGTVAGFGVLTDKVPLSPGPAPAASPLFADPAHVTVKISLPHNSKQLQPGLTVLVGIEVPERRKTRMAGAVNRAFAWIQQPFLARVSINPETEIPHN